jgi:hypothetical protein
MIEFDDIEDILEELSELHSGGNFMRKMRDLNRKEGILGILEYIDAWQLRAHRSETVLPDHRCSWVFCNCPKLAPQIARRVLRIGNRVLSDL